jgi:hypothetical protein
MDARETLALVALVIGVITGLATIGGWIASADLPGTLKTAGIAATTIWVGLVTAVPGGATVYRQETWPRRIRTAVVALTFTALGILGVFLIPWPDWLFQIVGAFGVAALLVVLGAEANRWHQDRERLLKKVCPDCLEKIKKEARVCRHCRYRFE